jgi:hypothetical protein
MAQAGGDWLSPPKFQLILWPAWRAAIQASPWVVLGAHKALTRVSSPWGEVISRRLSRNVSKEALGPNPCLRRDGDPQRVHPATPKRQVEWIWWICGFYHAGFKQTTLAWTESCSNIYLIEPVSKMAFRETSFRVEWWQHESWTGSQHETGHFKNGKR